MTKSDLPEEAKAREYIEDLRRTELECERDVERYGLIAQERPLHPHELVDKGRCLQMLPEEAATSQALEDAEFAFRAAIEIDEDHLPAYLELGWFKNRMRDDPARAVVFFNKAIELCKTWLEEARSGRDECLEELGDSEQELGGWSGRAR